jgi:hypothetical protein
LLKKSKHSFSAQNFWLFGRSGRAIEQVVKISEKFFSCHVALLLFGGMDKKVNFSIIFNCFLIRPLIEILTTAHGPDEWTYFFVLLSKDQFNENV